MDVLKKQLDRIQQQLAGLSATQKMLTASLVAIMVMTFIWWGHYAGTSEMEPVFNQSLSADDMQNVKRVLNAEGIHFEPSGDKILVPSEKKDFAIAALAYEQVLPRDSSGGFEDVISKMSPFNPPQTNEKMYNELLQQNLARIISKMHGVSEAHVIIDPTHDRHIGGNVDPTASISVQMRNGASADKKLAEAIAETVAGTNAHMTRSRVSLIIDGKVWQVRDRDPSAPDGEIDEQQANAERRHEEKIKEALGYFQADVIAVVHAKIDMVKSEKSETTHPKIQQKEITSETETSNSSTPQAGSGEPGAAANMGGTLSVGQASAGDKSTTETERTRTASQVIADESVEHSSKPAGEALVTSATVSVPRSYFIKLLKMTSSSDKEPTPDEVEKAFELQRPAILGQVMRAVDLSDEKKASVDMYFDAPLMLASGASSSSSGGTSSMTVSLTSHVKEIAVGMLAIVSLFMVSMMVKKSAPTPIVAAVVEEQEPVTLGGHIDIAGEVSEGGQTLDGMELDDDTVKAQQMVEQVSTMVKENPDGAASMVKRWLNRS